VLSPYSQYPSAHQDVLGSLLQGAQATNDLASAERQSKLSQQAKQFSQKYALQAMQNDMDAQSQRNNLLQNRMDGAFGPMSNLLRGLYQ
jgi:hypothetical protein